MNVYEPIAILSTSALVVLLACGGGNEAVRPAHAAAEQPDMVAARGHLREPRASLDRAEANKGGHREEAIELVDGAIEQVDDAIEQVDDAIEQVDDGIEQVDDGIEQVDDGIEWAKTH